MHNHYTYVIRFIEVEGNEQFKYYCALAQTKENPRTLKELINSQGLSGPELFLIKGLSKSCKGRGNLEKCLVI